MDLLKISYEKKKNTYMIRLSGKVLTRFMKREELDLRDGKTVPAALTLRKCGPCT